MRATYIGMHLARELRLPPDQIADLYYAELLMDVGCTAWTSHIAALVLGDEIAARRELYYLNDPHDPRAVLRWLAEYMAAGEWIGTRVARAASFAVNGRTFMMEGLLNTSDVAARLAGRLGRSRGVQEALRFAFEQWDGTGPRSRRSGAIPIISRVVYATVFLELFHRLGGREAAVRLARSRRGKALDPSVVDAFGRLTLDEGFWQGLDDESIWASVRQMEPASAYRYLGEEQVDDAARAFADFADLKSFYTPGHSRRVAALAERMALCLDRSPAEVVTIRRAALVHDLGLVAVPSFILHKPEDRLTVSEWESLRLHPYHAERILAPVPAFEATIPLVVAHHERPDGKGYFRGVGADQIPLGARLIAAADLFDELTHQRPERQALDTGAALVQTSRAVGTRLFPEALSSLARALDQPLPAGIGQSARQSSGAADSRHDWPAGLTGREVEVLRALSAGASRRDIAERLTITEHTVRHHLEHIYDKIGVRTRVAATLFAIEHDLLR